MRIGVIYNPTARGERARRSQDFLAGLRGECELKPTRQSGEARILAREAVLGGCERVVAAGGDGTVNEVLNGIGDTPEGFSRVALGVIPLGTVNVMAREHKIPLTPGPAWNVIRAGSEKRIDLPRCEIQSGEKTEIRYFAQLAGSGLDASAIDHVDWELKKQIGPLAYVWAGLLALRACPSRITVRHPGGILFGNELVLIGNGRLYGGPFPVFRQGDVTDGKLDVCVFPRVSLGVALRYFVGQFIFRRSGAGGIHQFQTESLELLGDKSARFEVEGETVGSLPVNISLQPRCLRLIVP